MKKAITALSLLMLSCSPQSSSQQIAQTGLPINGLYFAVCLEGKLYFRKSQSQMLIPLYKSILEQFACSEE